MPTKGCGGKGGSGGAKGRGTGGKGSGNGSRGGSRSQATRPSATARPKGDCAALGEHVFDYNVRGAADLFRTSLRKLVIHAAGLYGNDISIEIENRSTVVLTKPKPPAAQLTAWETKEQERKQGIRTLLKAKRAVIAALDWKEASTKDPVSVEDAEKRADIEAQIVALTKEELEDKELVLYGDAKQEYDGKWKAYNLRVNKLEKARGRAYKLILGQCTQKLVDRMKQESDCETIFHPS